VLVEHADVFGILDVQSFLTLRIPHVRDYSTVFYIAFEIRFLVQYCVLRLLSWPSTRLVFNFITADCGLPTSDANKEDMKSEKYLLARGDTSMKEQRK
jgi:hypothetical protein